MFIKNISLALSLKTLKVCNLSTLLSFKKEYLFKLLNLVLIVHQVFTYSKSK
jgi:hypothetical protein